MLSLMSIYCDREYGFMRCRQVWHKTLREIQTNAFQGINIEESSILLPLAGRELSFSLTVELLHKLRINIGRLAGMVIKTRAWWGVALRVPPITGSGLNEDPSASYILHHPGGCLRTGACGRWPWPRGHHTDLLTSHPIAHSCEN